MLEVNIKVINCQKGNWRGDKKLYLKVQSRYDFAIVNTANKRLQTIKVVHW